MELLVQAGLSRNVAKTLAVLVRRDSTTSIEIEKATGLRQPEVSIAMQDLRGRGWVEKRDIKKEGKGRPVHAYRLTVPFREIVDQLEKEQRAKITAIEANIRKLRQPP